MKIVLNKERKVAQLCTNEGVPIELIGEYSYTNMINKEDKYRSEEDFEADINKFSEWLKDKDVKTANDFQHHIKNFPWDTLTATE